MTTPAQEAKDFAALNALTITAKDRRYLITNGNQIIAEVGGYPAALNAMKRHVEQQLESVTLPDAIGIPADTIVGEKPAFVLTHVAVVDKALDPACKVVEYEKPAEVPTVVDVTFRRAVEDWNTGKVNHPFAPAAAPRTGYYVRSVDARTGELQSDTFCSNLKHAYHLIASVKNWYRRNRVVMHHAMSVIFKRGA